MRIRRLARTTLLDTSASLLLVPTRCETCIQRYRSLCPRFDRTNSPSPVCMTVSLPGHYKSASLKGTSLPSFSRPHTSIVTFSIPTLIYFYDYQPERCTLLDVSGSPTEPVVQPVGRCLPVPSVYYRHRVMVLIQLPQTETNAQGQSTTTVWRAIRANREDRVAKLEWAPGGGLGRAVIGKVRPSLRGIPHLPSFLRSLFDHRTNFLCPT